MKHGLPDRAGRHDPASSVAQIAPLFALAAVVLMAAIGSAFAAGFLIGRMLL